VGYTVFDASEFDWQPHRENDPRFRVGLSEAMTNARANMYRYPPGAVGRRHADPIQEEVFVVLEGTLTAHMGEDGAIERHELPRGSVLVVRPGTPLQLSNRHDQELRLFIIGAPPERAEARFLERVE
jgi:mannose-6-phosphate isomerase-like protein (cupin superfamily)